MGAPNDHGGFRVVLRVALSGLLLLAFACCGPAAADPNRRANIDRSELEAATVLAGDYLVSRVNQDGSFVYKINMNPAILLRFSYNWLRHAGALYALADFYDATRRPEIIPAIAKGAAYMQRRAIGWVDQLPGSLAVWSDPKITGSSSPKSAKLGGTALGLMTLTELERIRPGSVSGELQTGLAQFILAMQKPDGSFYSIYVPDSGGPDDSRTSLHYPGEAALSLTMLYAQDKNEQWIEGARRTLRFLSKSRQGNTDVPPDHWALIATERMWPHLNRDDRTLLRQHARQVVESILSQQVWPRGLITYGAFTRDGRTSPTANRVAGLLAAEKLFSDEPEFRNRIRNSISWGIRFLLNAQIKDGRYKGAVPRSTFSIQSNHPQAVRFNARVTEVRIDHVQQTLSAFIGYVRLLASES